MDGGWVGCGFLGFAGGMEDESREDEGRNGREGAWRVNGTEKRDGGI